MPAQYQQVNGYSDVISSIGTARNIFTRTFLNANTTLFNSMGGQHTIKAGMRFERFGNDVLNGNASRTSPVLGAVCTRIPRPASVAGKYGYYILNQIGTIGKVNSNNYSFWLQDSWTVNNRLTINAGVRTENEHVPSYKDQTEFPDALDISSGSRTRSRRASASPTTSRATASGRRTAATATSTTSPSWNCRAARSAATTGSSTRGRWTPPTTRSIHCGEGTTGCPGTFIDRRSTNLRHSSNQVDELLRGVLQPAGHDRHRPEHEAGAAGEFTAGLDHELNPTMSIGVRYVHKWMIRTIEDVGHLVPGQRGLPHLQPGRGPRGEHGAALPDFRSRRSRSANYDGIELRLNKRFSQQLVRQTSATSTAACTATTPVWRAPTRTAAPART